MNTNNDNYHNEIITAKTNDEMHVMRRIGDVMQKMWKHDFFKKITGDFKRFTYSDIDDFVGLFLHKHNVLSLKNFVIDGKKFPKHCCVSMKRIIAHGEATDLSLLNGLLRVDVVGFKSGVYVDNARTFLIGNCSEEQKKLLAINKSLIAFLVNVLTVEHSVLDVSIFIDKFLQHYDDCYVVPGLLGHAIGEVLHQKPSIPFSLKNMLQFKRLGVRYRFTHQSAVCIEPVLSNYRIEHIDSIGNNYYPTVVKHNDEYCFVDYSNNVVLKHQTDDLQMKYPQIAKRMKTDCNVDVSTRHMVNCDNILFTHLENTFVMTKNGLKTLTGDIV